MFGKVLVIADNYEKNLEMIGCVIDESAIKQAQYDDTSLFENGWKQLHASLNILQYPVPLKKENKEMWTINWVQDIDSPDIDEIIEGFSNDNKSVNIPSVQLKINNTVDYYKFAKRMYQKKVQ